MRTTIHYNRYKKPNLKLDQFKISDVADTPDDYGLKRHISPFYGSNPTNACTIIGLVENEESSEYIASYSI